MIYKAKQRKALWCSMPNAKPPVVKQRKWLRKVSKKREKENVEYLQIRKEFLSANPICQACKLARPGQYPNWATDIHHKKGRGKYFLDESYFLAVCRECHVFIGDNPTFSYSVGLLIHRI